MADNKQQWQEYYQAFSYFDPDAVRPGCEPSLLLHPNGSSKSIVLVHGLIDSPYSMSALADYFYNELGYDVYLPLLQCHGLKNPREMVGVSHEEWKANVRFALKTAAASAEKVSLGGFSTGGALCFNFSCRDPLVTGDLYLFAAAFNLYGGPGNSFSRVVELLLMTTLFDWFAPKRPLLDKHPYKYSRAPYESARQLVRLMRENKTLLRSFKKDKSFNKRIFSAWTAADTVISINALKVVEEIVDEKMYRPFEVEQRLNVRHASLMLAEPVYARDANDFSVPLLPANPRFQEMVKELGRFERQEEGGL
jgi:esterase/lipase